MADDLGFADLGVTGSRNARTPNIDQLADEGVFLHNGYANAAICSPTRAALLSGRYQGRFEFGLAEPHGPDARAAGMPLEQPTIASRLRDLGYFTALIGKWHLGSPPEHGPLQHGYDHFFGIPMGVADYFRHKAGLNRNDPGDSLFLDNEPVEREGYLTNLFADEAIRLIEQAQPERPFFISLHFNAPHWPWEGPFDRAISDALTEIFHRDGGSLETYGKMVESMDRNIGRILLALEASGLADNTIVVFTSDNGAERFSDTYPFVGTKGELLEGGIRVPIVMRWPDRIPPRQTSDQVMISMDFVPTFVAAAGGDIDTREYDGINLLDVLTGAAPSVQRTLYWRFDANDQAAVRAGDWKYLKMADQEHLFNVTADPRERAELRNKYPEKFEELKAKFAAWDEEMLPYPEGNRTEYVQNGYADRYPSPGGEEPGGEE
jgi:arylsulfatase A-like enzyme